MAGFHPTRSARILVGGQAIGGLGEVDPTVSAAYGLPGRGGFLTVSLEALLGAPRLAAQARPISRYPARPAAFRQTGRLTCTEASPDGSDDGQDCGTDHRDQQAG